MTQLYGILAREASKAVLFRRGPTKRVLLISWDTENDTFQEGQWFNGRIYERRGDLSPNGELLVYFAANLHRKYQSWTAVSRPPYLTALALWPKGGDTWGGGGLFLRDTKLQLNHTDSKMEIAEEFRLPKWLRVEQFAAHGLGEDDPIWSARLIRDGWRRTTQYVFEKPNSRFPDRMLLRMTIVSINNRNAPWYRIDHEVIDQRSREISTYPGTNWADWLPNGDLVYSKQGELFRGRRRIADFSDRKFRELEAPMKATQWGPRNG